MNEGAVGVVDVRTLLYKVPFRTPILMVLFPRPLANSKITLLLLILLLQRIQKAKDMPLEVVTVDGKVTYCPFISKLNALNPSFGFAEFNIKLELAVALFTAAPVE